MKEKVVVLEGLSPRRIERGEDATKSRNISRKDAKVAKKKYLSELGVLRALAGGISESDMVHVSENLRKPRNPLTIVPRPQTSEEKRHRKEKLCELALPRIMVGLV